MLHSQADQSIANVLEIASLASFRYKLSLWGRKGEKGGERQKVEWRKVRIVTHIILHCLASSRFSSDYYRWTSSYASSFTWISCRNTQLYVSPANRGRYDTKLRQHNCLLGRKDLIVVFKKIVLYKDAHMIAVVQRTSWWLSLRQTKRLSAVSEANLVSSWLVSPHN